MPIQSFQQIYIQQLERHILMDLIDTAKPKSPINNHSILNKFNSSQSGRYNRDEGDIFINMKLENWMNFNQNSPIKAFNKKLQQNLKEREFGIFLKSFDCKIKQKKEDNILKIERKINKKLIIQEVDKRQVSLDLYKSKCNRKLVHSHEFKPVNSEIKSNNLPLVRQLYSKQRQESLEKLNKINVLDQLDNQDRLIERIIKRRMMIKNKKNDTTQILSEHSNNKTLKATKQTNPETKKNKNQIKQRLVSKHFQRKIYLKSQQKSRSAKRIIHPSITKEKQVVNSRKEQRSYQTSAKFQISPWQYIEINQNKLF